MSLLGIEMWVDSSPQAFKYVTLLSSVYIVSKEESAVILIFVILHLKHLCFLVAFMTLFLWFQQFEYGVCVCVCVRVFHPMFILFCVF